MMMPTKAPTKLTFGKEFFIGVLAGVGISAAGYYLYQKNKSTVDDILRKQGINIPVSSTNFNDLSLESLVETKEHLEDLIAEREVSQKPAAKKAPAK